MLFILEKKPSLSELVGLNAGDEASFSHSLRS